MGARQFELFQDVGAIEARELAEVAAEDRRVRFVDWITGRDCCTGELTARRDRDPASARVYRCGRCGTFVGGYCDSLSHDQGYTGCGDGADPILTGCDALGNVLDLPGGATWPGTPEGERTPGYRPFETPMDPELLDLRHDRRHFPDCAGCGHAWGTHGHPASWGRLPEDEHCNAYCGCDGYVAPAGASFPWD